MKEQYKNTFKSMLVSSGRKKKWVQEQMKMSRIELYRAIHNDTLTQTQKNKITNLLSK